MTNHYAILGVEQNATLSEIKRAFREKAKRQHPDVAGGGEAQAATAGMRRILESYAVLSNRRLREQYDKIFYRPQNKKSALFDYKLFLKKRAAQPEYKAKLIFYDIFNFEEDDAVAVWQAAGGIDFPLEKFLDREDWMDCGFVLAEELDRTGLCYEAFLLLTRILAEERREPYFKHFAEDLEIFIKEIVKNRLRRVISAEQWIDCLQKLLTLGFPPKDEERWLKQLAAAKSRAVFTGALR